MPYIPYIVFGERSAVTGNGVFGAAACELGPQVLVEARTIEHNVSRIPIDSQRASPNRLSRNERVCLIAVAVSVHAVVNTEPTARDMKTRTASASGAGTSWWWAEEGRGEESG